MVKPFPGAPYFFIDLHEKIDNLHHRQDCLGDTGLYMERSRCGRWFVTKPISQAASKFLLAQNVIGLNAEGYAGEDPVENYTGQLIFTLAVAAFETYCRLLRRSWFGVYREIFTIEDGNWFRYEAQNVDLAPDFYSRLISAQDNDQLKKKICEFERGDDEINFYAVCVGFRNAFAHGRLGSLSGTLPLAHCARDLILQGIERDCQDRADRIE
jgi:hypothetical protein